MNEDFAHLSKSQALAKVVRVPARVAVHLAPLAQTDPVVLPISPDPNLSWLGVDGKIRIEWGSKIWWDLTGNLAPLYACLVYKLINSAISSIHQLVKQS